MCSAPSASCSWSFPASFTSRSITTPPAADPLKEKRLDYYRNTFSQLGIILIGIGISLSIFFFEKRYETKREHDAEVRQVLAKLAYRLSRAAAVLEFLPEYDPILDNGGRYVDPASGGKNEAITATGADLAKQIGQIAAVERDVDLQDFADLRFSGDIEFLDPDHRDRTARLVHDAP